MSAVSAIAWRDFLESSYSTIGRARVEEALLRNSLAQSQSQKLIELRARQMRSNLTASEQKLWAEIRGCRLGVWFRRQVPLGRYIADFVAPSVRLVVEVDGGHHAHRQVADARRDGVLSRLGYRVLRLDAELVERRIEVAVARVRGAVGQRP